MNIDIAALLLGGGAQGKPKGGLLADDGFSLQLDDKLAELVQLFPGLDPQTLAAMPEAALAGLSADLLPQQLADDAPVTDADGMLLAAPPGLAQVLNGVSLTDGEGEESPQWQLQQLVTRSVTGTETVNPAKGVANGKAPEPEGKTVSALMTAADKTPSANATPLTAQSATLTTETMVSAEMPAYRHL